MISIYLRIVLREMMMCSHSSTPIGLLQDGVKGSVPRGNRPISNLLFLWIRLLISTQQQSSRVPVWTTSCRYVAKKSPLRSVGSNEMNRIRSVWRKVAGLSTRLKPSKLDRDRQNTSRRISYSSNLALLSSRLSVLDRYCSKSLLCASSL